MRGRDHWLAVVAVLALVGCHDTVGPAPIEIDPEFDESGGLASIAYPYRADALDRLGGLGLTPVSVLNDFGLPPVGVGEATARSYFVVPGDGAATRAAADPMVLDLEPTHRPPYDALDGPDPRGRDSVRAGPLTLRATWMECDLGAREEACTPFSADLPAWTPVRGWIELSIENRADTAVIINYTQTAPDYAGFGVPSPLCPDSLAFRITRTERFLSDRESQDFPLGVEEARAEAVRDAAWSDVLEPGTTISCRRVQPLTLNRVGAPAPPATYRLEITPSTEPALPALELRIRVNRPKSS